MEGLIFDLDPRALRNYDIHDIHGIHDIHVNHVIAIDWGTSSFRAYRLGSDGRVLDTRSAPKGILSVENGKFSAVLEAQAGDWIAPGLTCRDQAGIPDVMRGEEVQILGVLDRLGPGAHTVCLPGTHSKWVEVTDGRIARFSTHMTGEAFAVLKTHSLLGRMMKDGATDAAALEDGVRRSADAGGLLHHLFGVRARGLFGELTEAASASYLSGMLIGHEIRSAHGRRGRVHVLCSAQLAEIYGRAFNVLGIEANALAPDSVTKGLFRLAAYL